MRGPIVFLMLLAVLCGDAVAQEAGREVETERQMIFGVAPFDGGKYGATFIPEQRDTIYLTAGFRHALTVNISDVYYWPLSAEYRADFQGMNVQLRGDLEIYEDGSLVERLSQREYVYVFPDGFVGEATRLLAGEEMAAYVAAHERELREFRSGERADAPTESYQGPFPGFLIELPAGEYEIRYELEREGRSFSVEKNLVVFSAMDEGVAFQIIPEDKWTVSLESNSRIENIYVDPGYVIYIKTFRSFLYNHANFLRMMRPQRPTAGIGLQNSAVWVSTPESIEDEPEASLRLEIAGQRVDVRPREYIVVQREGSSLGYDIFEFDVDAYPGEDPTFAAYRVPAPPVGQPVRLSVTDGRERYVRRLRTLDPSGLGWTFTALGLVLVLPFFSLVRTVRARRRARAVVERHTSE